MPSWVRGSQARHPFHYPRARCITRLIIRTLLFQSTVALVRGRGAGQGRGLKCQPLSRTNRVDASSLRDERITLARRVFVIRPISPIRLIHASSPSSQSRAWERQAHHCSASARCLTHPMKPLHDLLRRRFTSFRSCMGRDSQKDSCASRPNRRETSLFSDPTSLRCTNRSEDYTGQRDYAARLRSVASVRKTGRTHSAIHLCLTPRRKATCGTRERTPTPLRVPVLALRIASRSQCCWLALSRLRHRQVTLSPSSPGT